MAHKLKIVVMMALLGVIIIGNCSISVFAADDISLSLSSALGSNGNGITGGKITYFLLDNGDYGVRIDEIDFSGEWCSHNLIPDNKRCNYEIELWRDGELFKEGNWLTEVISNQKVAKAVITGSHCPSSLPNPIGLFDPTKADYLSTTCPSLADFTTNFHITSNGKYFIKIRMRHNDLVSDWSTHEPIFLSVDQTGNHDHTAVMGVEEDLAGSTNSIDLSGHWEGRIYQCKCLTSPSPTVKTFDYFLDIIQIGSEIQGTSRIEYDSYYAVMQLSGSLSNEVLSFSETEVLEHEYPPGSYYILKTGTLNCVFDPPKVLEGIWSSPNGPPGTIFVIRME